MRKYFTLILVVLFFFIGKISAVTDTIINSGYTFVPSELTINVGDEVDFILASTHDAVEVSLATWTANGNTSNGGFSVPFGGGKVTFNTPGTYYYVCQPHASLGMKGIIVVVGPLEIVNAKTEGDAMNVYPDPASGYINIDFNVTENNKIKIDLIDMTGRVVDNLLYDNYSQGNYKKTFSLANYANGKYFVRYSYGSGFSVKPLIIDRIR